MRALSEGTVLHHQGIIRLNLPSRFPDFMLGAPQDTAPAVLFPDISSQLLCGEVRVCLWRGCGVKCFDRGVREQLIVVSDEVHVVCRVDVVGVRTTKFAVWHTCIGWALGAPSKGAKINPHVKPTTLR